MATIAVTLESATDFRIFKKDAKGKRIGKGVLVKTLINFKEMPPAERREALKIAIKANWRIIVWLKGGRLK